MVKTWTEIPIPERVKSELKELKGSRTWAEFLLASCKKEEMK